MQVSNLKHVGNQSALSEDQPVNQLKAYYGLNKSWYIAYWDWMSQVLRGDLGRFKQNNHYRNDINAPAYFFILWINGSFFNLWTKALGAPNALLVQKVFQDKISSIIIFLEVFTNYVQAALLLALFAGFWDILPLGGFVSEDFESCL